MPHTVKIIKFWGRGLGKLLHKCPFSTITLDIAITDTSTCFLQIIVLILVISAAVLQILLVLWDRMCPGENGQFRIFSRVHHFM